MSITHHCTTPTVFVGLCEDGLELTMCDRNWIYVDRETYELKFGPRPFAEVNFKGPFDCTRQDRRLTLGGWEGFVAVQEGTFWALYYDLDGDRLRSRLPEDTPVLEVNLQRIEMRTPKPVIPPPVPKEDVDNREKQKEESGPNGEVKLESPDVD